MNCHSKCQSPKEFYRVQNRVSFTECKMVKLPTETKKIMMPGLEKVLELLLLKLTERKEKLSIIGHMSEIITFQGRQRRQDRQHQGLNFVK